LKIDYSGTSLIFLVEVKRFVFWYRNMFCSNNYGNSPRIHGYLRVFPCDVRVQNALGWRKTRRDQLGRLSIDAANGIYLPIA